MKVLTPEQMREVDRLTIESGIPGLILMENAACRVVEFLAERFSPLDQQRIVIVCGKGNNGGDGLAIARQLMARFRPAHLQVFLLADPVDMTADGVANYAMFVAAGGEFAYQTGQIDHSATLVIDALLGTGLRGPASGNYLEWIQRINYDFPHAKIVSVDTPSGLVSGGESVRADHTITFVAPKLDMVTAPLCEQVGELIVGRIGTLDRLLDVCQTHLSELSDFDRLLRPRDRNTHKGVYGHVLVVGGAEGKTGASTMAGLAALRAGAGLVTVAASAPASAAYPELMSASLEVQLPLKRFSLVAIGPGLGSEPEMVDLVRRIVHGSDKPTVIDADGLNALAGLEEAPWPLDEAAPRILTPHPGEMSRLMTVTGDRLADARELAHRWNCCVVLKGNRTVIAFADGTVWINPTGTPAMAKAGTGDILTGLIAGMVAQFPEDWQLAVRCAVYLHGRAGELAAKDFGDKGVLATDLLRYLYAGL
jgi:hydroxyethylthiazole kinase-like uncharacterized protein yjeF